MKSPLTYQDTLFVNFRHFAFPEGSGAGYRWVDVKRFRLAADPPADRDLLAALIAQPEFRDLYDGSEIWQDLRHGRWWADRIGPEAYVPVDAEGANGIVRNWAGGLGPVPAELDARLGETVYEPARRASSRYVLGELPEDARHDYAQVHIEFHELVLVDRALGVLSLVVAADD
ncbi:hypothetical protein [Streptomyces justiciae]|uniref:hypothetical protein n=1 Tax=Streptomyces justiciae TaxID=2780140 RepID=UPI002117A8D9|nr:hypothetical protein [Streptomyces justiciae]MCW8384387.1 hypothetical protein [Streptomyces justiciae]